MGHGPDLGAVLDASALIAYLLDEPGADAVYEALDGAVMSAVNWAEVASCLVRRGASAKQIRSALGGGVLHIEPVTAEDAERVADLRAPTRSAGLSLADRCCLALAERLGSPVLTADRAWGDIDVPADVRLIP